MVILSCAHIKWRLSFRGFGQEFISFWWVAHKPHKQPFFDTSHQEWELLLGRGRVCVTKQPYLFDEDAHVFVGELHMQLQDKTGMLVVVNARERDEERRPSVIPAS